MTTRHGAYHRQFSNLVTSATGMFLKGMAVSPCMLSEERYDSVDLICHLLHDRLLSTSKRSKRTCVSSVLHSVRTVRYSGCRNTDYFRCPLHGPAFSFIYEIAHDSLNDGQVRSQLQLPLSTHASYKEASSRAMRFEQLFCPLFDVKHELSSKFQRHCFLCFFPPSPGGTLDS